MLIPRRSSTWCPQRRNGNAASLQAAGFGSSHPQTPSSPPPGLRAHTLDEESCPRRARTLLLSASLLRECGTRLLCLLCPGQSVVSLPASNESVPLSSAPATSPTPAGPSHSQTSGRAQTSRSPPPPCLGAAGSPADGEAHLCPGPLDPGVPAEAQTPTQPGQP